jgi:hypothetical protein
MYKDLRLKKEPDFIIDVADNELSCSGCPTIYDFTDTEGTQYSFRLRHGYARIECEDTNEILLAKEMDGHDGICNWDDVLSWASKNGLLLR